ncbi:polysaccharide export protein, partial [bacterium]|nr:polysaccharide export protein [bacterium]
MNSKFFYIIPIVALFLFYEAGLSQTNQDKQKKSYFRLRDKLPYQLKEREELIEREFILEDAINAKEYIVGPGDVLAVYMWGQQENLYEVMVLPEGNIIIPSIGSIMINNMTLETAKELIIEGGKKYYSGAKITVSLTGIRRFKVHVSGEVLNRGSFDASPIDRISNVIALAQGFTSWADKKNIEITHLDGTTDIFDLFQFERKGNISQNPFIRGGDIIYIPRIKLSEGMVFISGNVAKPGYYQFYKNEAVSSL